MKNWKTTTAGVLAIVMAVCSAASSMLAGTPVDFTSTAAAIMAGLGLITAKDSNVTGGTIKQ